MPRQRTWSVAINLDELNAFLLLLRNDQERSEFLQGFALGLNLGSPLESSPECLHSGFNLGQSFRMKTESLRESRSASGAMGGRGHSKANVKQNESKTQSKSEANLEANLEAKGLPNHKPITIVQDSAPRGKRKSKVQPQEESLEDILGPKDSQNYIRFWKIVEIWPRDKTPAPKALARAWNNACTKEEPKNIYLGALRYQESFKPPMRSKDETQYMKSPLKWFEEEGWITELVALEREEANESRTH